MAVYLAEAYLARQGGCELGALVERLRQAAEALSLEGIFVRHLESVFLAADESCFHFFEAPTAEAIDATGARAAIAFDRVSEASYPPPPAGRNGSAASAAADTSDFTISNRGRSQK
jgi:hypothetical protein